MAVLPSLSNASTASSSKGSSHGEGEIIKEVSIWWLKTAFKSLAGKATGYKSCALYWRGKETSSLTGLVLWHPVKSEVTLEVIR